MRRTGITALLIAVALVLLSGCSSRVSPHDETIAAGLAKLQASHARFFDELHNTAGTPDGAWECHMAWYEETRSEIAALRHRAASYNIANDPTADALELLDRSVGELEQAHAGGLTRAEVPVLRTLFESQLRMLLQLENAKKWTNAEVSP